MKNFRRRGRVRCLFAGPQSHLSPILNHPTHQECPKAQNAPRPERFVHFIRHLVVRGFELDSNQAAVQLRHRSKELWYSYCALRNKNQQGDENDDAQPRLADRDPQRTETAFVESIEEQGHSGSDCETQQCRAGKFEASKRTPRRCGGCPDRRGLLRIQEHQLRREVAFAVHDRHIILQQPLQEVCAGRRRQAGEKPHDPGSPNRRLGIHAVQQDRCCSGFRRRHDMLPKGQPGDSLEELLIVRFGGRCRSLRLAVVSFTREPQRLKGARLQAAHIIGSRARRPISRLGFFRAVAFIPQKGQFSDAELIFAFGEPG